MESGAPRLTVGQLAEAAATAAKALRHYDAVGLFRPDGVDGGNGYRWYAADRLPAVRLRATCTDSSTCSTTGRRTP